MTKGIADPTPSSAITDMLNDLQTRVASLERAPWSALTGNGGVLTTGDVVGGYAATRTGCLLMDGSSIADATWPALCAYIRTNLPALIIDGANVHLPDARGNALVGANGATFVLGVTTGVESVTLTGAQSGQPAIAAGTTGSTTPGSTGAGTAHSHGPGGGSAFVNSQAGGGSTFAAGGTLFPVTGTTATEAAHTHPSAAHTHTTPAIAAANATTAHTNVQPSLPTNWFIKT